MFAYVAREPILDAKRQVFAYELLFRDGKSNCFPDLQPDEATSRILAANHLTLGLEDLACHKKSFINFHQHNLTHDFPESLDPESVVVELVDTIMGDDALLKSCQHIRDMGFKIALEEHEFNNRYQRFQSCIDIVKVDLNKMNTQAFEKQLPSLKRHNITLVAEKVETNEDFKRCLDMGFDYFQGYFFARPEVIRQKNISTSNLAMLELLQESASDSFDIDRLNAIFERDAGLAYMLLRFINNPMVNKREKITSLRHALNYLGQIELKKFVALLAIANLGQEKPSELLHLSLVRAKFCDLLGREKTGGKDSAEAFMVGLLSLLDAILDMHMEDVMGRLPIANNIKGAILGQSGMLRNYLMTARALESATWLQVIRLSKDMQISQKRIHGLFNEAIVWGNSIRSSVPGF